MKRTTIGILVMFILLLTTALPVRADNQEAQIIVDRATTTLKDFMSDKNFTWLQEKMSTAKAVLIFPQILKAGFIFGGSGGTGVLLVRDEASGAWSEPAFYTIGSASFGLQAGAESAQVMMLIRSKSAVDRLYTSSVKLGGDTSIALGPVGAGAKGNITADIVSFAMSKGIYGGINLEGSVLDVRESLNSGYYGKKVRPVEIIVEKKVSNPGADTLRAALKKASK